jgi:putative heme iron utilization protein
LFLLLFSVLFVVHNSNTVKSARAVAVAVNGEEIATAVTEASDDDSSKSNSKISNENEDYLWQLRLNVFEKAKTVASVCTSGTLCTVSGHDGIEGAPFGSFVDYVLDDRGNPVLLMNEMSMHTINIEKNALNGGKNGEQGVSSLVTLFTQLASENGAVPQGQDVSRCSFTCRVEKIPQDAEDMDAIRMKYSLAHTYADQVMDSPKFAFYRLLPEKIYYVGGFGVLAKWVDVDDYSEAAPDILAQEAGAIVRKLNREHQEDLESMAKHLLAVEKLENIRVTNVDRLGMDVRVTRQQGTRRNKLMTDEFRIGFRIPVISVEDAKSEILKVFQEAWEKGNGIDWGDAEIPGSTVPIMKIAADSLE